MQDPLELIHNSLDNQPIPDGMTWMLVSEHERRHIEAHRRHTDTSHSLRQRHSKKDIQEFKPGG